MIVHVFGYCVEHVPFGLTPISRSVVVESDDIVDLIPKGGAYLALDGLPVEYVEQEAFGIIDVEGCRR